MSQVSRMIDRWTNKHKGGLASFLILDSALRDDKKTHIGDSVELQPPPPIYYIYKQLGISLTTTTSTSTFGQESGIYSTATLLYD